VGFIRGELSEPYLSPWRYGWAAWVSIPVPWEDSLLGGRFVASHSATRFAFVELTPRMELIHLDLNQSATLPRDVIWR
jgi:hypothetical protein